MKLARPTPTYEKGGIEVYLPKNHFMKNKAAKTPWSHKRVMVQKSWDRDRSPFYAFMNYKVQAFLMIVWGGAYLIAGHVWNANPVYTWMLLIVTLFFAVLIVVRGVYEMFKK